jgi:hypothetical protein
MVINSVFLRSYFDEAGTIVGLSVFLRSYFDEAGTIVGLSVFLRSYFDEAGTIVGLSVLILFSVGMTYFEKMILSHALTSW